MTERTLCRLEDIPDGAARGFGPAHGGFVGLFAVRRGAAVFVYVNACPHVGTSLDWAPDRFLTADGALIVCATHGALFSIDGGVCVRGPASATGWRRCRCELLMAWYWCPPMPGCSFHRNSNRRQGKHQCPTTPTPSCPRSPPTPM